MKLSETQNDVHSNAKAHGWWDGQERSFGDLIALAHSELSEALEEHRNGHGFTETYYKCSADGITHSYDEFGLPGCDDGDGGKLFCHKCPYGKPEGIPSELADCVIRIMDMCGHYGIDLEAAMLEKHEYNKTRPYRHGGKVM